MIKQQPNLIQKRPKINKMQLLPKITKLQKKQMEQQLLKTTTHQVEIHQAVLSHSRSLLKRNAMKYIMMPKVTGKQQLLVRNGFRIQKVIMKRLLFVDVVQHSQMMTLGKHMHLKQVMEIIVQKLFIMKVLVIMKISLSRNM